MDGLWYVIVVVVLVQFTWGARDDSWCNPIQNSKTTDHKKPALPNQYEVHIECMILNKNKTTEIHEYFDSQHNVGAVRQMDGGNRVYAYYDYNTNEFIAVLPDTRQCAVADLSKTDQRFLFGYKQSDGSGHIFTASGALHFGGSYKEQYMGTDKVRGINVLKWYSCQYWKHMDSTMNVTWYFTDPNNWNTALGLKQIPVRALVDGHRTSGPKGNHTFIHIYDFMHFKNYINTPRWSETPDGVSCPGRKNTKKLPALAKFFSFTVEILDRTNSEVYFMNEWYDDKAKLTKYTYKPTSRSNSIYGFGHRPLTEIHDFNTGIGYVTDNEIGNCTAIQIEMSNLDDIKVDAHHVRIRTGREFFYMNATGVTFEGLKKVRGFDAYSWVGQRSDYPPGQPVNSTWEWRFRTDNWTSIQDSLSTVRGPAPIQLRLTIPQYAIQYDYNIYNFIQAQPNLLNWDISACYRDLDRRKFDFTVPGSYKTKINSNRELFTYSILVSLQGFLDVSPLRISKLRLVFEADVHIRFELLDVAPMVGDVKHLVRETPLILAADILMDLVKQNKFVILLDYDTLSDPIPVVVTPHSLREFTYEDELRTAKQGYTPGAMGGLAVGMIILGGALGGGVSFFVFK